MQPEYTRTDLAKPGQAWPRFYVEAIQDEGASQQQGRPIFREREMVEIFLPGNTLSRPTEIVRDNHRQQWPKEYEAFKAGQEPAADGLPLDQWPALRPANVLELRHLGFRSVEDVASMSETAVQRIGMGARALKDRAMAFLDDTERMAALERKSAEVTRLEDRLAAVEAQNAQLGALLQKVHGELTTIRGGQAQTAGATDIPGVPPLDIAGLQPPAPAASSLAGMTPPRRTMSPEERAAIGQRLKDGRAAKRASR